MRKFTTICLAALAAVLLFARCNSDMEYHSESTSASVAVYSFGFQADDSVLANLDTVFFSIDLDRALIFNGDSLPYGTHVDKLVPKSTMLGGVSMATLTARDADGKEVVHDYLESQDDTVNFTHPVYLDVKSPDGLVSRRYTITVNVHTAVTDTLVWDRAALRTLPSNLGTVADQHTTNTADGIYCLSTDNRGSWCVAYTQHAFGDVWDYATPALPAGAKLNSFTGTADALYILDNAGVLYRSTDGGKTWLSTGQTWSNIYGGVDKTILGNVKTSTGWQYTQYPAGGCNGMAMESDMPVTGTSQLVDFMFSFSDEHQAVMVGGVTSNGSTTGAVWAYDGANWAKLNGNFAKDLSGVTLLPYYAVRVSNTWVATDYSLIMAMGGVDENDAVNDTVYVTTNYGMTWEKAPDMLQLPEYLPDFYGAQAFVEETTLTSRSASAWVDMPFAYRLPASAVFVPSVFPATRATKPITSWECPFIYLFGGYSKDGELHNSVWRAAITRFTFKPIQ